MSAAIDVLRDALRRMPATVHCAPEDGALVAYFDGGKDAPRRCRLRRKWEIFGVRIAGSAAGTRKRGRRSVFSRPHGSLDLGICEAYAKTITASWGMR
jgi:hypothetical protein